MAATMSDVAKLAGVSIKSVSNFYNGYPYMKAETKARIEAAIEQLDYRMNVSARNLRSGKTGMIELVIPQLDQSYFAELAQAVVDAAEKHGLRVLVEITGESRERELEMLSGSHDSLVDGVIYLPLALGAAELEAARVDFPLVLIGEHVFDGPVDYVNLDNYVASRLAVEHLLSLGRRRIVALGVDYVEAANTSKPRREGYVSALQDAGIEPDPALMIGPGPWRRTYGASATDALLDSGVEFDAIFALNDALALGALHALLERGVRVPEEVAVIGFDDTEDASFSSPGLTSINPGREQMARKAVELLYRRINSPDGGDGYRYESFVADYRLIVRGSTVRAEH
jgi:DNA-binding LacI/PurR family transcriptional regulator